MLVVISILFYGVRACLIAYQASHPTSRETGAPEPMTLGQRGAHA